MFNAIITSLNNHNEWKCCHRYTSYGIYLIYNIFFTFVSITSNVENKNAFQFTSADGEEKKKS